MEEGFTIPTKEANTCLELARLFIGSLGRDKQDLQELHATFADWVVDSFSAGRYTGIFIYLRYSRETGLTVQPFENTGIACACVLIDSRY